MKIEFGAGEKVEPGFIASDLYTLLSFKILLMESLYLLATSRVEPRPLLIRGCSRIITSLSVDLSIVFIVSSVYLA